jgi:hypothetical protein
LAFVDLDMTELEARNYSAPIGRAAAIALPRKELSAAAQKAAAQPTVPA